MSRIGKKIIEIPDNVKVEVKEGAIHVQGPKGTLMRSLSKEFDVVVSQKTVEVKRKNDLRETRALHGITRTLISNMVVGVAQGFEKKLEIEGLGMKAQVQGQNLTLNLGFTHPVEFLLPKGVEAKVEANTKLTLISADKELVGRIAAKLRSLRPPEPYNGTGVRYAGEVIIRKVGKTTGAATSA